MKLLRRATGAMKDKSSIYLAEVRKKKEFRNPHIEVAMIKATSHDDSSVDYKSAQRVFEWVRTSPAFLKPLLWSLTKRLDKTRCWIVAVKGLMLIHGVFCTKIPAVRKIGRLPFDLSNFHDKSSTSIKSWEFTVFVRAYFAFLDQHSTFLGYYHKEERELDEEGHEDESSIKNSILRLNRSQDLLDLLLQIKPYDNGMEKVVLILEATDCIVVEIFDVYSGICSGIASVLSRIFTARANEAAETLHILQRATSQITQLSEYFRICRELGIMNAAELPPVEQIPEEDIVDLERLIRGIPRNGDLGLVREENEQTTVKRSSSEEEEEEREEKMDFQGSSGTIVTKNWVVFDDESPSGIQLHRSCSSAGGGRDLNGFWQLHHQTKQMSMPCFNLL